MPYTTRQSRPLLYQDIDPCTARRDTTTTADSALNAATPSSTTTTTTSTLLLTPHMYVGQTRPATQFTGSPRYDITTVVRPPVCVTARHHDTTTGRQQRRDTRHRSYVAWFQSSWRSPRLLLLTSCRRVKVQCHTQHRGSVFKCLSLLPLSHPPRDPIARLIRELLNLLPTSRVLSSRHRSYH